MTETSTPSDVQVKRDEHAQAMRVLADMHAAYGAGLDLDITATGKTVWFMMSDPVSGEGFSIGFFDDGDVFDSTAGPGGNTALACMDNAREFMHAHGHGRR